MQTPSLGERDSGGALSDMNVTLMSSNQVTREKKNHIVVEVQRNSPNTAVRFNSKRHSQALQITDETLVHNISDQLEKELVRV